MNKKCAYCKEETPMVELETFHGQGYCPDCMPEVIDQYEEYQEYLSNQD